MNPQPALATLFRKARAIDLFSLPVTTTAFYAVMFYAAPFLAFLGVYLSPMIAAYGIAPKTLWYVTLGLAGLLLGLLLPMGKAAAKRIPNILTGSWNPERAELTFLAIFLGGITAKVLRIAAGAYFHLWPSRIFTESPWYSAVGYLDWFGPIAMAIAFLMYYELKKSALPFKKWQWYAWGTFLLELAYTLPTCSKFKVIIPFALYLLIRHYALGLRFRTVVGAILFVAVLFPASNICRDTKLVERLVLTKPAGDESSSLAVSYLAVETFFGRLNQSIVLQKIIEADEPKLHGKSLLDFLVSLGPPRFIWKNKPLIGGDGNEFGRKIGILNSDDFVTSVGPTHVGDWYMNFGLPGIFAGMFLMGTLWRFLYEYLIPRTARSPSGVLLYGIAWVQIMKGMENAVAPVYAGMFKIMVLLVLIHLFMKERRSL